MKRLLHPDLEYELRRALGRWRWQRFWRDASLLGITLAALLSTLALMVHRGYLKSPPAAILIVLGLLGAGALAFLVVTVFAFAGRRPRAWLASSLEGAYHPLLDRLNTLVHLEPARHETGVSPYFRRIEEQAVDAVPIGGLPLPFHWRNTLLMMLAALVALAGTFDLYRRLEPWERLSWNEEEPASSTELPDPEGPPLAPPDAGAAEVKAAWGEVRITEPGRDLKVTKVDVVPLQVEAATDQPLKEASWSTATNGAAPRAHALPAPPEPNYAVYRPMLYVDELRLQDWDVVSYFASAHTTQGASYASEIYFLEVRPFREDIAKMPGGEGGAAYQGLNELTGLIDRQRHILRETHRYQQAAGQRPEQRRQDRAKLALAEADLGEAVRHLYAKLAAEMENQPIGDVLTHLAAAEGWIDEAHAALRADAPTAMAKEQGALTELVATRKSFQKFISENPGAFGGAQGEPEDTPTAKLPEELKQILELRDQEKAAQELVKKTLDAQRKLAEKAAAEEGEPGDLAEEQKKLAGPLRDLKASQPKAFKGAEKEAEAAVSALDKAAKVMEQPEAGEDPGEAQREAVSALEKLDGALGRKRLAKELGHAYKLKEALDREAEELKRMQAEPAQSSAEQAARAARDAKQAARGLKKIVEEKPGQDAFGPELGQALSGQPLRDLESRLDALEKAPGEGERGKAAGEAGDALERVSQAFEQSQPPVMKELKADRLKAGAEEALETALAQLDGLTAREKPASPEDEAKRRREILLNMRRGLEGQGDPQVTARLLLRLEEALAKALTPEEKVRLKKLREEIEDFRVEAKDRSGREADKAQTTRVDPSRLPASYRDRIQRYFRKLSEE
jgi:hypothetical protein